MRRFAFLTFFTLLSVVVYTQNVTAFHNVEPINENNTYLIKTSISGLQGVDIARITYYIDKTHTYNTSPNNSFFSDRNDNFVKFYIMAIPNTGKLNIELGVTLSGSGEFAFPVEFQYSKNEEKKSINFPQINIAGEEMLVIEETPTENKALDVEDEIVEQIEPEENLENKIKAEEATRLAEEKAQAEEEEKLIAEQKEKAEKKAEQERIYKEKHEAEELARVEEEHLKKEKMLAEKLAADKKAEDELAKKMEEERIAKDKAEQEAKEKAKAEEFAKAEEAKRISEEEAKEVVVENNSINEETVVQPEVVKITPPPSNFTIQYSIQILSLSKFSQFRLDNFIKQHNLDKDKIVKRQVGELTKISYGKLNSKDEVREMIQKLRRNHNITDAFLVTLP